MPEYWSGWPFPSPGDLPNRGIKPRCPALQVDSLLAEPQENENWKLLYMLFCLFVCLAKRLNIYKCKNDISSFKNR